MYDLLVLLSRILFIRFFIFILSLVIIFDIKAKRSKKIKPLLIAVAFFISFLIMLKYGFIGVKNYNVNIKVEELPGFFSNVIELFDNEYYRSTFDSKIVSGTYEYIYEADGDVYNKYDYTEFEQGISGSVDGVFYKIAPVSCSHNEFYVLGIPNSGKGKLLLYDNNHMLILYYSYRSDYTDCLFPMIAREAFFCRDIELAGIFETLSQDRIKCREQLETAEE